MSRFDLSKGERFNLTKGVEGLNHIRVELTWNSDADLDAEAFCLNENELIVDDADFVYYKSLRRASLQEKGESDSDYMARIEVVPYDRHQFGPKINWFNQTVPYSTDGSVIGSRDDPGSDDDDEENGETLRVDLTKVRPQIQQIIFCVTIHQTSPNHKTTFNEVGDATITIINADTDEKLCSYRINEQFTSEDAMVAGAVILNDDGEWEFVAVGNGYDGGLQTLVDMYA